MVYEEQTDKYCQPDTSVSENKDTQYQADLGGNNGYSSVNQSARLSWVGTACGLQQCGPKYLGIGKSKVICS